MPSAEPAGNTLSKPPPGTERVSGRFEEFISPLYLRLAILLAAILLPAVIFTIFSAYDGYRENQERTRESVMRFGEVAATRTQLLIDSTRRLLIAFSTTDVVAEAQANFKDCGERLGRLAIIFKEYQGIAVTNAAGQVICGSSPSVLALDVVDRPWFQQIKSSNGEVVTPLVLSKRNGSPVVIVAVPLSPPSQAFSGAVATGIDAIQLAGLSADSDLPAQSSAFLVDRSGVAVTHSGKLVDLAKAGSIDPAGGDVAGLPDFATLHSAMAAKSAQFLATGTDGMDRLYSLTNLERTDLFVVVGLPESGPIGWAKRDFARQLAAAAAMLLCALIGVAVGGDLLIARNIRALSATAQALQRGDYAARPAVSGGSREVRQLAGALTSMAEQVQRHEQDMQRSVQQKEAMLKEIHHRVKNNLQVVTSLMSIQANRLNDEASKKALAELQRRVRALGLLHRHLYEGDDLRYLDFGQFTVELCQMVKESSGPAARAVTIQVDIPPIPITADRAVPLGLLITEALGNAFKHGFPDGRLGTIRISLSASAEGVATVTIADNGIGPAPESDDGREDPGTGMLLMHAFAQQLGSVLTIEGPPGTTIRFSFDLTESVNAPAA